MVMCLCVQRHSCEACIFDIHQLDVVALKACLTRDGRSDADIDALPSMCFRDRYLP